MDKDGRAIKARRAGLQGTAAVQAPHPHHHHQQEPRPSPLYDLPDTVLGAILSQDGFSADVRQASKRFASLHDSTVTKLALIGHFSEQEQQYRKGDDSSDDGDSDSGDDGSSEIDIGRGSQSSSGRAWGTEVAASPIPHAPTTVAAAAAAASPADVAGTADSGSDVTAAVSGEEEQKERIAALGRLVKRHTTLTSLSLQSMTVAEAVAALIPEVQQRLQKLRLEACDPRMLGFLPSLTSLQHLAMDLPGLDDWQEVRSSLNTLTGLRSLELHALRSAVRPKAFKRRGAVFLGLVVHLPSLTGLTQLSFTCPRRSGVHAESLVVLTRLQELKLQGPKVDAHDLAQLKDLSSLRLFDKAPDDLAYLSTVTTLTCLEIWQERFGNISGVSTLTSLQHLSINMWNNPRRFIPWLAPLTNLRSLQLSEGAAVLHDWSVQQLLAVPWATQLRVLQLCGCFEVSSLNPFQSMQQLQRLDLLDCNSLTSLQPLTALRGLKHLNCLDCERILSIQCLESLDQLETLTVHGSRFTDLVPLKSLTKLKNLDLGASSELSCLSGLEALTGLEYLHLGCCSKISSLVPLASLTGLTKLELRQCGSVSSLVPLQAIQQLALLDLTACAGIRSVKPLQGLRRLRTLHAADCPRIGREHLQALTQVRKLVTEEEE